MFRYQAAIGAFSYRNNVTKQNQSHL